MSLLPEGTPLKTLHECFRCGERMELPAAWGHLEFQGGVRWAVALCGRCEGKLEISGVLARKLSVVR